jgi:hypothetical protein
MRVLFSATRLLLASLILVVPAGLAGQAAVEDAISGPTIRIDGPPAPIAPAVITRDAEGRATVRAIRLTAPIDLDGRLDEAIYRDTPALSDFIQVLPGDGDPATEKTEMWITFDADNIYVSARAWDSAPESEWTANEMRRDTNQLRNNDNIGVSFDTFYDHRNAFFFYANPLGARSDVQHTNEGNPNSDWNPIWDVRTGRFEGGWTVEMQIPFKSLRYRPGRDQVWGVQLRRTIRRKNEWTYLTYIPRSTIGGGNGAGAVMRISRHATLVGIEAPSTGRVLEVKPYAISGLQTDLRAQDPFENDGQADAGLDVKLGVTESLFADFTVNTDFAQVEADEQQVNLTRFEISFPEKREFFLEGRDIYAFGIGTASGGGGGGNAPTLFFSRRIGVEDGQLVPIRAGGRLTGKVGAFDVGVLSMQTGSDDALGVESTNFSVLRLRRDVFSRGSIGALFTRRSHSTQALTGSNETYGVDGNVSMGDVFMSGYYAETRTDGLAGDDEAYRGGFSYSGDVFAGSLGYLRVGENFNPEVGFLRRSAFRALDANANVNLRPGSGLLRRIGIGTGTEYVESDTAGYVESRENRASVQFEFESSDMVDVAFNDTYEYLDRNFRIADGVILAPGRYSFRDVTVGVGFGLQRWYSGNLSYQRGSFYSGDKTTIALRGGRINVSRRLSLEPSLSINRVDLPEGSFRTNLAVTRVNYAFTPLMFLGGLVQYNSGNDSFSTNLRFRWEYRPGSELFIVYTEARDTEPLLVDRWSELANRGLTIKLNYLLRL